MDREGAGDTWAWQMDDLKGAKLLDEKSGIWEEMKCGYILGDSLGDSLRDGGAL